jgi:hypothetical protein
VAASSGSCSRYPTSSAPRRPYLVQVDTAAEPRLGHDPEEIDADHRKLVAVAWRRLEDLPDNPEIKALTAALGPSLEQGRTPA